MQGCRSLKVSGNIQCWLWLRDATPRRDGQKTSDIARSALRRFKRVLMTSYSFVCTSGTGVGPMVYEGQAVRLLHELQKQELLAGHVVT